MSGEQFEDEDGGNPVLIWATVFEKEEWSTPLEIIVTLINISDSLEYIDEPTAKRLRQALKNSNILKKENREIMEDVETTRGAWPKDHWWWYPEKIK